MILARSRVQCPQGRSIADCWLSDPKTLLLHDRRSADLTPTQVRKPEGVTHLMQQRFSHLLRLGHQGLVHCDIGLNDDPPAAALDHTQSRGAVLPPLETLIRFSERAAEWTTFAPANEVNRADTVFSKNPRLTYR